MSKEEVTVEEARPKVGDLVKVFTVDDQESTVPQKISENDYAVKLQAYYRGHLCRRRLQMDDEFLQRVHRMRVVKETVDTEESYVKSLVTLVKIFIHPLSALVDTKHEILNRFEFQTLFGNIDSILNLNQTLLSHLKAAKDMWPFFQVFGPIFLEMAPFLKLYALYVNNYSNALNTLTRLLRRNKAFAQFVESNSRLPRCGGMDLSSFLIMPIQRIPRYKLLLKDLVKHTPKTHVDYDALQDAFANIHLIALYVNERKRQWESHERVYEFQRQLTGSDAVQLVSPSRRFVFEGPVFYTSARARMAGQVADKVTDWWIVFNDALLVVRKRAGHAGGGGGASMPAKGDKGDKFEFRDLISLGSVHLKERSGSSPSFLLEGRIAGSHLRAKRAYAVHFTDEAAKRAWVRVLSDAIREHMQQQRNFQIEDTMAWEPLLGSGEHAEAAAGGADGSATKEAQAARPPPLAHHTSVAHEGYVYVFGGLTPRRTAAPAPPAGGEQDSGAAAAAHAEAGADDAQADSSGSLAPDVSAASATSSAASSSSALPQQAEEADAPSGALWRLEVASKEWTQISAPAAGQPGPCARYWHAACVVGDALYVFGGFDGERRLADVWRFALQTNTWTRISATGAIFEARAGHSATSIGRKVFIVGGRTDEQKFLGGSVCVFDTFANVFSAPAVASGELISPRAWHSATKIGSRVFIFGGFGPGRTLGDLLVLETSTMSVTKAECGGASVQARYGHSAVLAGAKIFLFGGRSPLFCFDDIFELQTDTLMWAVPPNSGLRPVARYGHTCTHSGGRGQLVFIGGMLLTPPAAGAGGGGAGAVAATGSGGGGSRSRVCVDNHILHILSKLRQELFAQLKIRANVNRQNFDETIKIMSDLSKSTRVSKDVLSRVKERATGMTWFNQLDKGAQERMLKAITFKVQSEVLQEEKAKKETSALFFQLSTKAKAEGDRRQTMPVSLAADACGSGGAGDASSGDAAAGDGSEGDTAGAAAGGGGVALKTPRASMPNPGMNMFGKKGAGGTAEAKQRAARARDTITALFKSTLSPPPLAGGRRKGSSGDGERDVVSELPSRGRAKSKSKKKKRFSRSEFGGPSTELEDVREMLKRSQKEAEKANAKIARSKVKRQKEKADRDREQASADKKHSDAAKSLQREVDEGKERSARLNLLLSEKTTELRELGEDLKEEKTVREAFRQRAETYGVERLALQQDVERSGQRVVVLEAELRAAKEATAAVEADLKAREAEKADLERQLREARQEKVVEAQQETRRTQLRALASLEADFDRMRDLEVALMTPEEPQSKQVLLLPEEGPAAEQEEGAAGPAGAAMCLWHPRRIQPAQTPDGWIYLRVSYENRFHDSVIRATYTLRDLKIMLSDKLSQVYRRVHPGAIVLKIMDHRRARVVTIKNTRALHWHFAEWAAGGGETTSSDGGDEEISLEDVVVSAADERAPPAAQQRRPATGLRIFLFKRRRMFACLPG